MGSRRPAKPARLRAGRTSSRHRSRPSMARHGGLMRRRISLTIVAVVAGALLLSGLASLLLVARAERQKAESDVTRQAQELATDADQIERPAELANLARIMKLSDLRLVTTANGRIVG